MTNTTKETDFKLLTTLSTIFVTLSVTSVAIGYKLIAIKGYFLLSGAAFILPFRYLLGNILTEVYGYHIALKQLMNLAICCLLFSVLVTIVINIPSPSGWPYEPDFKYVLGGSLKMTITALIGMIIGVYLNIFMFTKMKIALKINSFYIRAFVSSTSGELLQYMIVLSIIYHSHLSLQHLLRLIFSDYIFQVICIFLLTPIANIISVFVKKCEKTDKYLNYNPFKATKKTID